VGKGGSLSQIAGVLSGRFVDVAGWPRYDSAPSCIAASVDNIDSVSRWRDWCEVRLRRLTAARTAATVVVEESFAIPSLQATGIDLHRCECNYAKSQILHDDRSGMVTTPVR
jgi:hypothetical protein